MKVFVVNKKIGQTPLEAILALVKKQKLSQTSKYTYAGRLDPMAEGVLIILANATQKQKEKYCNFPKKYCAEILFGLGTDSGDILGIPKKGKNTVIKLNKIQSTAQKIIPEIALPLPIFSSVPIKGKPAFVLARQGKKINMPKRLMKIYKFKILSKSKISTSQLHQKVKSKITKVKGDFRQTKILKAWARILKNKHQNYQTIKIEISCGSGTYIRSVANFIGKEFKTKAMLINLKRISVGKFSIK